MEETRQDENRRARRTRKRSWSAADTVLVLLAILVVAGLVFRVVYAAQQDRKDQKHLQYIVEFEIINTHKDALAGIKSFDAVYLAEKDSKLGYIAGKAMNEEGIYPPAVKVFETPETRGEDTVIGNGQLVCTEAVSATGGILLRGSDRYLVPGSVLILRTDTVVFTARITEIRLKT